MVTIDILIADDQNFVRKTLESYLEPELDFKIVGFAENGAIAVQKVEKLRPDIVLMDLEMPVMDGLKATQTITQQYAETKVLMLSMHDCQQDVARALQSGAKGYWLKNTSSKELANAIRSVHRGYFQLTLELVDKYFGQTFSHSTSSQEVELHNRLSVIDTVLAQVEQKIDSLEEFKPHTLSETVEDVVRKEISLKKERDVNLQFKLDRLTHRFKRLEEKATFSIKALLISNIVLFFILFWLSYIVLTQAQ